EFGRHNIDNLLFKIEVENTKISDQDPEIIKITYQSTFDELSYISRRVLIEIGARSLLEPSEGKEIKSIIDENYHESSFTEKSFIVKTNLPEKTFLEKMILLHEEFSKPKEKIRYHRMSRHLYDIGQIISTEFGERALKNESLFQEIIKHRAKYTPIKTVNYSKLELNKLKIIPPDEFIDQYEKDYSEMQENMIYGEKISFNKLINKILSKTPSR
ncbi:MAG TPA: nucleotidyl transferase AbiEii/AbiGii toxin family protein, partial [Ignavibacteria bacterium]|nr:nucleotidyl transferase AbiEii/AbiGii toxin family protein [Ignavibacteria bacterium]